MSATSTGLSRRTVLAAGTLVPATILLGRATAAAAATPTFHWSPGVAVNIPYAILSTDPAVTWTWRYVGRGSRTMYDGRVSKDVTVNAYLFNVNWPSGQQVEWAVNPDLGSQSAAQDAVLVWAARMAQLPWVLRSLTTKVHLHNANAKFTTGNGIMTIYADDQLGDKREEILVHEAGHNLAQKNSLQTSTTWKGLQTADQAADPDGLGFISQYAWENPTTEDVSESFLAWFALRHHSDRLTAQDRDFITATIPNRIAYFDSKNYDVTPAA